MGDATALTALAAKAAAIGVVDAYQYLNTGQRQTALPYNLRILLRRKPASRLGGAVHDQCCLVVPLETAGRVHLDKQTLRLHPGEALLIFPGQFHDYSDQTDADVFWLFASCHLDGLDAFAALRSAPVRIDGRIAEDLAALLDQQFHRSDLGKRHTASSERQAALRLGLVLEQLLEIRLRSISETGDAVGAAGAEGAGDTSHPLVRGVIAYVSRHLDRPISIADIAAALHVSAGHLRNEFARHVGSALGHYVRYMKMAHACRLMDSTELSLAEIGLRCGYSSIYAFSRAFKAEKGVAPSAYRKTYRQMR